MVYSPKENGLHCVQNLLWPWNPFLPEHLEILAFPGVLFWETGKSPKHCMSLRSILWVNERSGVAWTRMMWFGGLLWVGGLNQKSVMRKQFHEVALSPVVQACIIHSVPAMAPGPRSAEINRTLSPPLRSLLSRERLWKHVRGVRLKRWRHKFCLRVRQKQRALQSEEGECMEVKTRKPHVTVQKLQNFYRIKRIPLKATLHNGGKMLHFSLLPSRILPRCFSCLGVIHFQMLCKTISLLHSN